MGLHLIISAIFLAAAVFLPSRAWVLNTTRSEVEVGKTQNVNLECVNNFPEMDISEILFMRIQKRHSNRWTTVAELRDNDTRIRLKSENVFVEATDGVAAGAFLRLTWPVASNDTIGQYRCDVIILTSQETVQYDRSLPVSITLKSDIQVLRQMVMENKREYFQQLSLQKKNIEDLNAAMQSIKQVLNSSIANMKTECQLNNQEILDRLTVVEVLPVTHQYESCTDVKDLGPRPLVNLSSGLEVVCDTLTDGGGWIVIQRRASADVDFYRGWNDYKYGFGDLAGNFWLGLEHIHKLTNQARHELRFDMTYKGNNYFASYENFWLSGETEKYKIHLSGFSGNVSDHMARHNGFGFTTKDNDNDAASQNCATRYHGAWWYEKCHSSNLNGKWGSTIYGRGLVWLSVTTYYGSVSSVEMKIRPLEK
ncbi:fibrinogen-like protein 1 isoform X2 [Aplysia californica]|uniref:Fibrinogen-like protein 1 isoform X2 n=1 Tax=Aplysia californica TaxID=6500 RepID=A0ABM0JXL6_APLCA|nr:fibrinogen-like protein 1 isoform X2 [Aplysia californica]